ncbi:MAG TPA: glycosyltransferase, partial [Ignavibacteriaceae bacterium]
MFKVLVIAYYFPPMGLSGVQRTLKFVKYMKDYNWEPTVITTGEVGYFAHDNSLMDELNQTGVRVIRVGGKDINSLLAGFGTIKLPREFIRKLFNKISQSIFFPDNKISWAKKVLKQVEQILKEEHFDLIFLTGPPFSPFHVFAKSKNKLGIPLVFDYRDLWFGSYFAFYPTPIHKFLHKRIEYRSLKKADLVVVTNRKIKENMIHNFPFLTHNDVAIITHGYDPEDFENVKPLTKHNDRMVLLYSGIFMVYNTPEYLFKAFKEIAVERPDVAKNIELHFVGFLRKENKNLVKKLNLQEFVYDHGYLDHHQSIVKLISGDVLWLMVGRRRNIDAILPGKLYEYVGSR